MGLRNPSFERDSQNAVHFGPLRFAPAALQLSISPMHIASLLAMRRSPISSLRFSFTRLTECLVQIDSNVFLLLTKFGCDLSTLAEPEVTHVIWATSAGAVRRVLDLAIEADDEVCLVPPMDMTFGVVPEYAALLATCKEKWPSATFETASYRIASDGRFVCREIETRSVAYYFRHPEHNDKEAPFLIKCRLSE